MLADGTVRELDIIPSIVTTLDFKNDGNKPIPIVDSETGEHVGQDTTLNMTFVQVLAVIRQAQLALQS